MLKRACIAVALLSSAACSGVPRQHADTHEAVREAHRFLGCYQATAEGWLPGQRASTLSFVLDSVPPHGGVPGSGEGVPGAMWASASIQRDGAMYWQMTRQGIRITIGNGLQGREIDLSPSGNRLIGRTIMFAENFRGMEARVSAQRVPCTQLVGPP